MRVGSNRSGQSREWLLWESWKWLLWESASMPKVIRVSSGAHIANGTNPASMLLPFFSADLPCTLGMKARVQAFRSLPTCDAKLIPLLGK